MSKCFPRTTSRLILAIKNVFFKEFHVIGMTWKPSSLAKIEYMTLTSFFESKKADIDFFWKVAVYQIHETCTRSINFLYSNLCLPNKKS